ncbi:hypothetical protein, partial [Austwickia sp. TVS 96-490-7B]|uniref:hypothetical protein n=1 Tax=Austwickia sp. TVS 96-490-7B TaxID=2830843 RepID=UPI001C5735B7
MHDHSALTVARGRRVLRERIRPAAHRTVGEVRLRRFDVTEGEGEPVPFATVVGPEGPRSPELWSPAA